MQNTSETHALIAASKVEGTTVYDQQGTTLGTVEDIMLDKRSGKVAYAVMSFGGFLGIGDKHHPLPWSVLDYDTTQGGYVVNLTKEQLTGAPTYDKGRDPNWSDRAYEQRLHDYYGVQPYWGAAI